MASLFSTAIVAVCAGASGQFHDACMKAVDAGTRQVGWRQEFDRNEELTFKFINSTFQQNTNQETQTVVGAAFYLYHSARDRKLAFKLPTLGICDSFSNEVSPNSYALTLKWYWR